MTTLRKRFLGAGFSAAWLVVTLHGAHAMNGPATIQIDGGPLGPLQLQGGLAGYLFYQSGASSKAAVPGSFDGTESVGANLGEALIQLSKTDGILQFTIAVGPTGTLPTLGGPTPAAKGNVDFYRAGPLYIGELTVAPPDLPITISAGQVSSIEGYEGGLDWENANIFASDIYTVENAQNVGVSGTYKAGPLSATVTFGDGWDTRVFNFLQALVSYNFNDSNALSVFYGGNLGRTGLNTRTYAGLSVGSFGANYMNSQLFGAYYAWTRGNFNLVPEVQYVYAHPDHQIGIDKFTSNFGAALFADYSFGTSPYSLGGMAEYFTSNGPDTWFIAPHAAGVAVEMTPTWQYKDLFARLSVGVMHLTNGGAYGNGGNGKTVLQGALEGGVLF